MATISVQQQTIPFIVNIHKVDLKRFKGLVKLMGWTVEQTREKYIEYAESPELLARLEQARSDIREGKGAVCSNQDELQSYLATL